VGRADHPSRGVLPSVMCLSMIVKPQSPDPLGPVAPWKENSAAVFKHLLFSFLATV